MFRFLLFFLVFLDYVSAKIQNPIDSIYIKSKDMNDLMDYTNGSFGSENDCLLLLKCYFLLMQLHKSDIKFIPNIVQIYQQLNYVFSQYFKKPIEDNVLQLDDIVIFYVVKKSSENHFIKSIKEVQKIDEDNINNIMKYLNKNAKYCELPLTLFRKRFSKLNVHNLSYIEDGDDLIVIVKKQQCYVHSIREDLARIYNLLVIFNELTVNDIYNVNFSEF